MPNTTAVRARWYRQEPGRFEALLRLALLWHAWQCFRLYRIDCDTNLLKARNANLCIWHTCSRVLLGVAWREREDCDDRGDISCHGQLGGDPRDAAGSSNLLGRTLSHQARSLYVSSWALRLEFMWCWCLGSNVSLDSSPH